MTIIKKSIVENCCFKIILFIFTSILAGYALLVLVQMVPGGKLSDERIESVQIFQSEGPRPRDPYSQRILDNFTDAIMLSEASYQGDEGIFTKAAMSYYQTVEGCDPVESFSILNEEDADIVIEKVSYQRYWHGYLVLLKPLFSLLNYKQIRSVNKIIQYGFLISALILFLNRLKEGLLPFLLMILFYGPTATVNSLQYSSIYYIMMIEVIVLLKYQEAAYKRSILMALFLSAGIVTAYFDLLTTPTVTVSVPLSICCMIWQKGGKESKWKELIEYSFLWLTGYVGMWAGKWIIAFAFSGNAFFQTLIQTIQFRMSNTALSGAHFSRWLAIKNNISEMFENSHLNTLTVVYFILVLGLLARRTTTDRKTVFYHFRVMAGALIPFMIPILWILMMANHSLIHSWFTYRTLTPCIFCLFGTLNSFVFQK